MITNPCESLLFIQSPRFNLIGQPANWADLRRRQDCGALDPLLHHDSMETAEHHLSSLFGVAENILLTLSFAAADPY